jgi:hypothetical protein
MCLAATALDLIVVVAVPRYQVDDYLVGDKVFPVCAGFWAAVVQHHLCAVEVYSPLLEQVFDLAHVSYHCYPKTMFFHIRNDS